LSAPRYKGQLTVGLVDRSIIGARRTILWGYFLTELIKRPPMFTKNGGGFNSNGAVKYVFPHGHFVGGKRTNKLHNGRKNMCTEATDVTFLLATLGRH